MHHHIVDIPESTPMLGFVYDIFWFSWYKNLYVLCFQKSICILKRTLVVSDFVLAWQCQKRFLTNLWALTLNVDRKLASLKNQLVVTTPLGEQILRTLIFKGCEVLVKGVVLKANLILLEMFDFDVILDMDWLSNHCASMNCFTKKIVFRKPR